MEIKREPQTVEVLFSPSEQKYKIPIYQRRYVWNQKNWEKLWIDVQNRPPNGLFTGIIVTRLPDDPGDLEVYDVIDGQQRLTTFQIILCVIRDICWSIGHTSKGDEANELIQVDGRHKLHLKEGSDDKAFRALVDSGTHHDHIIHEAYKHFNELIKDYTAKELDDLYIAITQGINVAQINLIEGDVSEKIFASLNATGRMLNEFDYLRNDLFLRAGRRGANFYDSPSHWHPSFEKDKPSHLDDFFRNFLKANLGPDCFGEDDIKPFELYQEDYRKLLKPGDIEGEFKRLSAYAGFRKEMDDPDSEINSHMQFYEDLNLPRLDSFILFARHKLTSVADLPEVCKVLESYIVRRMLCDGRHVDSYDRINFVFDACKGGKFTASDFANSLLDTWPDNEQVTDALEQVSRLGNSNLVLYILYRLELYLRKVKGDPLLSFTDLDTFEQIVLPDDLISDLRYDHQLASRVSEINEATNSIGNIIPLTSAPPPNWSKCSFTDKQQALKKVAPCLILTEEICRHGKPDWNVDDITKRTEQLLFYFGKIWP